MARGSIVKRCPICKKNFVKDSSDCSHKEAFYSVVYRVGKRQKWEMVGPNKKDAERRLAEAISRINNGTYTKPTDILFEDFADKWLEQYARPYVKPSTFRTYKNTINHHLIPVFKGFWLADITSDKIQGFIANALKTHSPKTVNNTLILMKTMFKYARRWKHIRESPAQDIDNAPLEHKEMDFLNPEEVNLLLKYSEEPYETLFLTAILTGMRRGELLGLQWGDIDWNSNTIFVRRSLYWLTKRESNSQERRRPEFLKPKTKYSTRAIVMSPHLKEALEIHRLTCPVSFYDLVFCNKKGEPYDPDNLVKKEFLPTLVAAGLRRIRFHDLRHTYTSLLIAQGENIKFIQSQLGHSSIQTTIDRYGHIFPANYQGVGPRIDQQVFGNSPANTRLTEHPQILANTIHKEQK